MIRELLILVISFSFVISSTAQYNVDIQVNGYTNDTLVVGYYHGDKQLVRDTLYSEKPGKFKLAGKDTLASGLYLLLTYPDKEFIQFNVNDEEKNFSIEYDLDKKHIIKFKGSKDNTIFQEYVKLLHDLKPQAQVLRDTIAVLTEKKEDSSSFEKDLDNLDKQVTEKQELIMKDYPNSISAKIIKSGKEVDVPEFENSENQQLDRYLYYKSHYFDNLDLADPTSLKLGVLHSRIDNYLTKLTSNHPDSICVSLDYLLTKMEPAEESFRYYLSTFLNKYGKSKVIGYDAIYVHLVDKYYGAGKAPWVDEENMLKIVDNANKIRPSLIGKIGADLQVYKEGEVETVTLSEIDYEYLVLLFWAPDCGHCTKMMPKFVEFNEHWKDTGVKVFAICTKHSDKTKTCWESLEKKDMLGFINAADEYHRSKFKTKYHVSTTPKVFILDKNREILMKSIGADQLDSVMREILTRDDRAELIPAPMPEEEKEEKPEK